MVGINRRGETEIVIGFGSYISTDYERIKGCNGRYGGLYVPSLCHKCYEVNKLPISPADGSWD